MAWQPTHSDPGLKLDYEEYIASSGSHQVFPTTVSNLIANSDRFLRRPYKYHLLKDGSTYYIANTRNNTIPYSDSDAAVVLAQLFAAWSDGDSLFIENGEYSLGSTPNILNKYITIEGESIGARLIPPTAGYALKVGDGGTTDCQKLILKNFRVQPASAGVAHGLNIDGSNEALLEKLALINCNIGAQIKNSSRTRNHLLDVVGFTVKGLYYPTGTALRADQYINNAYIETAVQAAEGIVVEDNVNGIRITDLLMAGAGKTGLTNGIRYSGSYSGIWQTNVIIDSIYGTGILLEDGPTHGCTDIQLINTWCLSCEEFGLKAEGNTTRMIESLLVSNSKFNLCGKSGVSLKNLLYGSFENCEMKYNALDNISGNDYMTNIHLEDRIGALTFDHCWIINGSETNRKRPARVVTKNGSYNCVRFVNCYIKDPDGDEGSRIGCYKTNAGEELYAYAQDCFIKNSSGSPNDTVLVKEAGSPQDPNAMEEVACQINKAFGW